MSRDRGPRLGGSGSGTPRPQSPARVDHRRGAAADVYVWTAASLISGFWLLVFYPGVVSYYAGWLWDQAVKASYDPWNPPVLAMLIRLTQYVTDRPDLISFAQGAVFWAGLFFLLREVSRSRRWFLGAAVFVTLLPPLWLYTSTIFSNVWMAACGFASIMFLIRTVRAAEARAFWLSILWFSGAVAFRREALVLLPVFLFVFHRYLRVPGAWLKTLAWMALATLLAAAPARLIEHSPGVQAATNWPAGHGLLNQYIGTVTRAQRSLDASVLQAERSEIDRTFGEGAFDLMLDRYRCRTGDYISVWPLSIVEGGIGERHVPLIVRKVAAWAVRHPGAFLGHNLCYYRHLLQIEEVAYQDFGVLRANGLIEFWRRIKGFRLESLLPRVKARYVRIVNASLERPTTSWMYAHYWLLIAAFAAWVAGVRSGRPEVWVPALFALWYPLGYLLISPSSLWRYLLFSYACGWVSVIAGFQYAAPALMRRIRGGRSAGAAS